jgi:NAD(P)-dependent dehydrogenase (short-subunit alcohol dehydrogenase family)
MHQVNIDPSLLLSHASAKVVLITGGANGIGAATASLFNAHGAKVVISDLDTYRKTAENLITTFPSPENAVFVTADILDWHQMTTLFKEAVQHFGALDIVIANAGTMESHPVLDLDNVDDEGNLNGSTEGFKVIDINLKGTLNSKLLLPLSLILLSPVTLLKSPATRSPPHEIQARIYRPNGLHIRLLWRHRCDRLCSF